MENQSFRFGLCTNMVYPESDPIALHLLPQLKEWGYAYVEFSLRDLMTIPQEGWGSFCKKVERIGLPVEACNNFFPPSQRITGPKVDFESLTRYTQESLQRAKDLGAKVVVFGSSGARNLPEGFPREAGMEQIRKASRMIAEVAEKTGVLVAIEYHNRGEANILNTMKEAVHLCREVNHPHLQVLSDYYHMAYEKEPVEALFLAQGLLVHAHFAEVENRSFPKVPKEEYREYFSTLKRIGYQGRVSVEAFTKQITIDAPLALHVLKECSRS
ncbi:MAG: sugar phosphate isomerase/epimerase [Spirochaetes bacterium]|nr:sugar phosphate isomerase/epimerase [Spirochaetota bacterium]